MRYRVNWSYRQEQDQTNFMTEQTVSKHKKCKVKTDKLYKLVYFDTSYKFSRIYFCTEY